MAKRPGRPPLDPNDQSVNVCFRLPGQQYDDLYRRAQKERTSIGDVIRTDLAKQKQRRREDRTDDR